MHVYMCAHTCTYIQAYIDVTYIQAYIHIYIRTYIFIVAVKGKGTHWLSYVVTAKDSRNQGLAKRCVDSLSSWQTSHNPVLALNINTPTQYKHAYHTYSQTHAYAYIHTHINTHTCLRVCQEAIAYADKTHPDIPFGLYAEPTKAAPIYKVRFICVCVCVCVFDL